MKTFLLAGALCAVASSASAKFPDPRFSSCDPVVYGDPDGSQEFRFVGRDVSNAPVNGCVITLDFSATSVRLYAGQEAGTTVNCANRTLSRFTGHDGVAVFHPRFGGGCAQPAVVVYGDGVNERVLPAVSTDLDGDASVGLNDVAVFADAFLKASIRPELDFDGSGGAPGLGDFTRIVKGFLAGTKSSYCP